MIPHSGDRATTQAEHPLVARFRAAAQALPPKLLGHTARVVSEARRLGALYDLHQNEIDLDRLAAAAWGHDLYRAHDDAALLQLAAQWALPVSDVERAAPILLHGPVAAIIAEREWGIDDAEILDAIRWHTTAHPNFGSLGVTLFLADKLEPAKVAADPGLRPAQALAKIDPDAALVEFLERRTTRQLQSGEPVHPLSLETRNAALFRLAARG